MATFQELMARASAERSAGWGETGRKLTKQSQEERFSILDYLNQITSGGQAAGAKDVERKRRRSGFRLGGAVLGGLLGLAVGGIGGSAKGAKWGASLGAGAGSLAGSKWAQSSQPGGWRLKDINPELAGGMFFKGGREEAFTKKEDVSRYISEANKAYDQAAWRDAITDALSARKMMLLDPRKWWGGGDEEDFITNELGERVRQWKPEWDEWMPSPPEEDYFPSVKGKWSN